MKSHTKVPKPKTWRRWAMWSLMGFFALGAAVIAAAVDWDHSDSAYCKRAARYGSGLTVDECLDFIKKNGMPLPGRR